MIEKSIPGPEPVDASSEIKAATNRLATTSLVLALVGWGIYLLQWCFDLSIGLVLAVTTGGTSALCSTILDVLPFGLWIGGIISGHVAWNQIKTGITKGKGRAAWGLGLSYVGLFFTLLLILLIVVLIVTGIHAGWLEKLFPFLHK